MTDPDTSGFATGGIIPPGDGQPITRTSCGIPGYCPVHDSRVITIRGGKPVDVTDEAIEIRMPTHPDMDPGA